MISSDLDKNDRQWFRDPLRGGNLVAVEGLVSFKDKNDYTSGVSLTRIFYHAGQAFF